MLYFHLKYLLKEGWFCKIKIKAVNREVGCCFNTQKQLPEVFWKKKVFLKILQILQETPVLQSLLNKFAGLRVCNFI